MPRILTLVIKLVLTIALLWAFVFGLVRALTPDPGAALSGLYADAATRNYLRSELQVDRPFLPALGRLLYRAARMDFGFSLRTMRPVTKEIGRPFAITLSLSAIVASLATVVAVGGLAVGLNRTVGSSSSLTALSAAIAAFPGFLVALILSPLFPLYGGAAASLSWMYFLLPSIALLLPLLPYAISLGLRLASDMRRLPWFETYLAFGFAPQRIAVLRGGSWMMRGIAGVAITAFLVSFTGSVVVEIVCGIPGLGPTVLDAIDARDLPVVLAVTGLTGTLAGVLVLLRGELERAADV